MAVSVECDFVEVDRVGLGFVNVIGDGGEGILAVDLNAASEGGGAVHAGDQVGGDGFAGFVVMSELGEDLRAANPFFEHLRRSFDEIGFHADAGDAGPLLLAAEDVVHQVAEFVEESLHVAVIHEAGIVRSGCGKVADEDGFGKLLAADAVEHRSHFGVAVLAGARVHVEIEAADRFAVVDDDPGFDGGVPGGNVISCWKLTWKSSAAASRMPCFTCMKGK